MGLSPSDIKKQVKKKSKDAETRCMAYIDSVMENLQNESKDFERACIAEIQGDKKLPISKILKTNYEVSCSVKEDPTMVAKAIENVAQQMMDGEFAKAISTVLSTAITVMVGKRSASSEKKRSYIISVGELGSVMRIDYMISVRNIQAQQLISMTTNIVSVSYILSSVKLKGMNANDLVSVVEVCYSNVETNQKMAVLARILDLIRELNADQEKEKKI